MVCRGHRSFLLSTVANSFSSKTRVLEYMAAVKRFCCGKKTDLPRLPPFFCHILTAKHEEAGNTLPAALEGRRSHFALTGNAEQCYWHQQVNAYCFLTCPFLLCLITTPNINLSVPLYIWLFPPQYLVMHFFITSEHYKKYPISRHACTGWSMKH